MVFPKNQVDVHANSGDKELLHELGDPLVQDINLEVMRSHAFSIDETGYSLSLAQKQFILKRLNFDGLTDMDSLPISAAFMIEKVELMSALEALQIVEESLVEYADDPNVPTRDFELREQIVAAAPLHSLDDEKVAFPESTTKNLKEATRTIDRVVSVSSSLEGEDLIQTHKLIDWDLQVRLEAATIHFWSPYPEVRAVSEPYDDPSIACETIRVYIIGCVWTAIGTFIGCFFHDRQPSILLPASIVQLLIYPSGILLEKILPKWKFTILKREFDLNPGPWTHKEQMLATIFYSVAGGLSGYATSNITVQKMDRFYGNDWVDFGFQTLIMLSSNFLGFGFAGIMRKVSVYPIRALWPTILPTLALNKALMQPESREIINGWSISRYNFLGIVAAGSFLYYWFPAYLAQFLSTFNWMTWIKPDSFGLATVTGSVTGLGLNPITSFDWNIINFNAALTLPFWSQASTYIGGLGAFICTLALYYSNYKWTKYLPINTNRLFNNKGKPFAVRSILNDKSLFDNDKYQEVGPPFFAAANLIVYGAFFAIYPFVFCYEILSDSKFIWLSVKKLCLGITNWRSSTYDTFDDPHSRMMAKYKEVPEYWFLSVLVISTVLAILCVTLYPLQTPVWTVFFAIGISFVFFIPVTIVYSVTGFQVTMNVLVQIIIGYILPGNPLCMMFVKALGTNIDIQAQNYVSDQKMGHYVKIPPRALFRTQMLSVFISTFINLGVLNWVIENIPDYCGIKNRQKFTCPLSNTFFTASVIWGVIGPRKIFNGLYPQFKWCFLIGFLLVFPCVAVKWYAPRKYSNYFQPVVIIGGFLMYAPYNLSYYTPGFILSWFSMHFLKRNYTAFWQKYNYVFSGAMTAGLAFSSVIVFFAVQYKDKSISWWGNNVMYEGLDGAGIAYLNATESALDGYFGPRKGSFP